MDPRIFHHVTLVAFLAWVGLGADGLSSSAYGPEAAFKALGQHAYLAVALALMTAGTVLLISLAYSKMIELFPGGGGGYLVATKLLGPRFGVVSGNALIVDYILTISISVASGVDQIFSILPERLHAYSFTTKVVVLILLIILNLRGVKESVTVLVPIFLVFVAMHFLMIVVALVGHFSELPHVFTGAVHEAKQTASTLGFLPMLFIILRAYSLGGGTYTGIEAVSNGVPILREPKVHNAKKTMLYMAVSLAFTASGIILGYLVTGARPHPTKVMNAVLAEKAFGSWAIGGFAVGNTLVILTLVSAGCLLFVAAQAGFLDGPDPGQHGDRLWAPHRFAQLSGSSRHEQRDLADGNRRVRVTLGYTRGSVDRRRHVRHQRFPDVQPHDARHVAALDPSPRKRPALEKASPAPRYGTRALRLDTRDHDLRKVRGGRVADRRRDLILRRPLLPRQAALSEGQGSSPAPRRSPPCSPPRPTTSRRARSRGMSRSP
jgi:hypothetical protein